MATTLNANTAMFDAVMVFNIPMLFAHGHVEPETLPDGVFQYAVRHHREDTEKPIQITEWAVANRFGSLLSSIPITMEKAPGSYVKKKDVDVEKDWQWSGYSVSLGEYLDQHPVSKSLKHRNYERQ